IGINAGRGERLMNKHILIAEDEDDMRHLISQHLKNQSYHIIQAVDGQEAISKIKASIDLVLLDIMMPKLSGLEVCKRIRQQVDCPIVFISAASNKITRINFWSMGGYNFISKPFSLKELTLKKKKILKIKDRYFNLYKKKKRKQLLINDLEVDLQSRTISYNNN